MPIRDHRLRLKIRASLTVGRRALAALVVFIFTAATAAGDYRDSFESPEPSWKLADADCAVNIVAHQRDFNQAHSGNASERIAINSGRGTFIHLIQPIAQARVIAEWGPRLWIRSDRPGIQLMARVVLPRARDPQTGAPLTTLLRGDVYDRAGAWQQLWIHRPDQILERQVRVLRSQFGPDIDAREAYVDLIVLNGYGGVGVTNIWIDDLEISGHVPAVRFETPSDTLNPANRTPDVAGLPAMPLGPLGNVDVHLQGSVLIANGVPFFPRTIEYNGESFEWLGSLGFNAIRLTASPTPVQLREAHRLGLWLIAPPPNDNRITADHGRVIAWDLGYGLGDAQLDLTRQRVTALRKADVRRDRPLIAEPRERIWSYSRMASFLVMRASPVGTSFSLPRYSQWLRERPTLARPGTPIWATVQTELPIPLVEQWSAFGVGTPLSLTIEPEQIRHLAYEAIADGARGLIFQSRSPLDRTDADSQNRARMLRQLNLELLAIEPWAAAGTRMADVSTDRPDIRTSVLQTERAQLLLVLSQDPYQQFTRGPSAVGPLSLIVPRQVRTPQVYQLTPGGLRTMPHRRVAGGIRITLDQPGQVNLVAIAQDPLVLNHLARTFATHKTELANLHRETAATQLELVEAIHQQAVGQSQPPSNATAWLAQARSNLRHAEMLLGSSDPTTAFEFADKSLESLAYIRRIHWTTAAETFALPATSPYCVSLSGLPLHWEMVRRLQASPTWSANMLPAGDMASLDHLQATGWENYSSGNREVITNVELSNDPTRGGATALRLVAWPATRGQIPTAFESAPLKIVTAPVSVRQGQLIRIRGLYRIPQALQGTAEGMKIYDSIAGQTLALRLYEESVWAPFVFYRAALQDGTVAVTFELSGLGEAWIDDIEVSIHESIADRYPNSPVDQTRRLPPIPGLFR